MENSSDLNTSCLCADDWGLLHFTVTRWLEVLCQSVFSGWEDHSERNYSKYTILFGSIATPDDLTPKCSFVRESISAKSRLVKYCNLSSVGEFVQSFQWMISVLEDPRHHPLGPLPRCESIRLNETWDVLSRSVLKYSRFIESLVIKGSGSTGMRSIFSYMCYCKFNVQIFIDSSV